MNWKIEIKSKIDKILDSVESEILSIQKEVDIARGDVLRAINEYTEIQKQISDSKSAQSKIITKIEVDLREIASREEILTETKNKIDKLEADFQSNIAIKKRELDRVQLELDNKNSELSTLQALDSQKSILLDEMASLNTTISQKSATLTLTETGIISAESKLKETLDSIESNSAAKIKEIEDKLTAVLIRENEVSEREKKVTTRESDIGTIIQRYQKLYADKGVGFKI